MKGSDRLYGVTMNKRNRRIKNSFSRYKFIGSDVEQKLGGKMLEILKSNEIIWLVYVIIITRNNYISFQGKKGLMMLVPISIIIANVQVNKLVTLFGTLK